MLMLNLNKVRGDSSSVDMPCFNVVNSLLWHVRSGHDIIKECLKYVKMI